MEIGVLGPILVLHQGDSVSVGGPQRRTLLALLAIHANEAVSAGFLVNELWGDNPPPAARKSLQSHVAHLRRILNSDQIALRAQPPGYVLTIGSGQLDSLRFEELLREAVPKLDDDPERAHEKLSQGLAMWRGAPLADVADESLSLRAEVNRLNELRLVAWEHRLDADLRLGRHAEVVAELEHLVGQHPLRERLWSQLMLALYRSGRQADALAAYQRARRLLADELGIEPSGELRQLEERILLQDAELSWKPMATPAGPAKVALIEKDDIELRLPAEVSSFIGRAKEIERLNELLHATRLLTITGAGGSGKTRLALQVAAQARDFLDGVWFVGLAGLNHPELLSQEVARALQLPERPDQQWDDLLKSHLEDRNLLLVVDNCEHLVSSVAELCLSLLEAAPGLRILATSREALGIHGETTWQIPLLSNPTPEQAGSLGAISAFDSPRLFIERARSARPDLTLTDADAPVITEICRRLDGLPLALELAAARVRAMSLGEIAAHLDDRFALLSGGPRGVLPRHQTLEATVAWSYDLLPTEERRLFEHLSVFHGGFDISAAMEVGGERALAGISSLVDKSLVLAELKDGKTRYRMLETVAAFGRDRSGEGLSACKDAHLRWMTRLARLAAANLEGGDQAEWIRRVQLEIDNVRAALEHALLSRDYASGMVIVSSLFNYWYMRGVVEGRQWLDRFLSESGSVPDEVMAWAKFVAGALRHQEGEHESEAAGALLEQSLELFQKIKDPHGIAYSIHHLARTHWGRIDPEVLRLEFKTALTAFTEVEDWVGVATSMLFMVWVELEYGEPGEAVAVAREIYELSRRIGSSNMMAHGSEFWATALWNHGDYGTAGPLLHEALELYTEVGNAQCSAHCLDSVAAWTLGSGDPETAATLLTAVDALRAKIGTRAPRWERFIPDGVRERLSAAMDDITFNDYVKMGETMGLEETMEIAIRATS